MEKQQTAVGYLIAHIYPHLDWSKVETRALFREIFEQSTKIEREQIIKAFNTGAINPQNWGNNYYNDTYISDLSPDVGNMVEISDEEIEKGAVDKWDGYKQSDYFSAFEDGAKWYREQLKKKQ